LQHGVLPDETAGQASAENCGAQVRFGAGFWRLRRDCLRETGGGALTRCPAGGNLRGYV
jgi:hypothetical protein